MCGTQGYPTRKLQLQTVSDGGKLTKREQSVKGGVFEREDALLAGLFVMHKLPDLKLKNFHMFAAAGELEFRHAIRHHPKMQILSVAEILEGKRFQTPTPISKTETEQKDLLT